jgi:uncharacterized membrane protein
MNMHEKKVVGVYDTEQDAIAAIENLIKQGYYKEDISVIGKNVDHVTDETGTAAEESAVTGVLTGGTLGGVTGLLIGAGALAIPGIGPIVAAGPIAASLMGILTGASIGGLTGALVGLGIPDEEAEYYGNSVKEGKILVLIEKSDTTINDRNYLTDTEAQANQNRYEKSLTKANNSSMTQDMEEMKRLGNEMDQSESGSELRTKDLTPDPIQ